MARKRTGQLILRKSGYYARLWTRVDGEWVRITRALNTHSKPAARAKLARLLAAESGASEDVKRAETFAEAARRVYAERIRAAPDAWGKPELASLEQHVVPLIGERSVLELQDTDINMVLDEAAKAGLSQTTVGHLKQRMVNVWAALKREPGGRRDNPAADAVMPKFANEVRKERAVLTDAELAIYLAWQHPVERFRLGVLERQTLACVARMFGGLRTGDLHALKWEGFDMEAGGFEWGYAPRQKTRRPQLLEVPAMLRPILRGWWERAGRPAEGLVFPIRRIGSTGDRVGEKRGRNTSHAASMRLDLERAFEASTAAEAPRRGSRRWRELFTETDFTLPVDFHSWRRAFAQALADADVNAQQAAALAGHADMAAHQRYLRNAGKMRVVPAAALPAIAIMPPEQARSERVLVKGAVAESARGNPARVPGPRPVSPRKLASGGLRGPVVVEVVTPESACSSIGLEKAAEGQKATTSPNEPAMVAVLPAQAGLQIADLLAAIDSAAVAGDLHAVRRLTAEVARLERERASAGTERPARKR